MNSLLKEPILNRAAVQEEQGFEKRVVEDMEKGSDQSKRIPQPEPDHDVADLTDTRVCQYAFEVALEISEHRSGNHRQRLDGRVGAHMGSRDDRQARSTIHAPC